MWVKSWQTVRDRHTNSQRNKQSPLLLSAAVITYVAPVASYQSESVSTRTEVQNNTNAHPQPIQALLWLTVSQLRATPPAVVHFTALWMRDMGKCQNLDFLFLPQNASAALSFSIPQPAAVAESNNEINNMILQHSSLICTTKFEE